MYRDVCGKCGATRVDSQLGLERTPEEYVCKMVELFRELRRALKDDGTCWINLGDSYNGMKKGSTHENVGAKRHNTDSFVKPLWRKLKEKDLVGIPWRVAFALQADGWYLRSDIIWHKPNPMPESVTDRPTKSHEYIFLLSKSAKYYYDADAVREAGEGYGRSERFRGSTYTNNRSFNNSNKDPHATGGGRSLKDGSGRNRRSVWTVTTKPYRGAHFATYPEQLIEPCILAGTSAKGECPKCGAAWVRVVELGELVGRSPNDGKGYVLPKAEKDSMAKYPKATDTYKPNFHREKTTVGWQPQCACGIDPVPQIVLDPFNGAGTTGVVAKKHGRRYIGIELNPEYLEMARERLDATPLPLALVTL